MSNVVLDVSMSRDGFTATELLKHLYEHVNGRDIDAALTTMHPSVEWFRRYLR